MLRGYQLDPDQEIHALRMLRSLLQGFATLEAADGFQIDADVDDSFTWMVTFIDHGLRAEPDRFSPLEFWLPAPGWASSAHPSALLAGGAAGSDWRRRRRTTLISTAFPIIRWGGVSCFSSVDAGLGDDVSTVFGVTLAGRYPMVMVEGLVT